MASPFYLFRKYQKAFIAIAAVIAMFIFVLADPLMSWIQSSQGGGQRSAGTIAASWDGGSLNVRELELLAQRRFKISQFLQGLIGTAAGKIEAAGGTALPPTLPDFILRNDDPRSVRVGCVTTRVLAELAEDSGIHISDGVINHYLTEWGLRKMGNAEIANLLGRVGMSDKTLFAGLRELLMGNFYINSYALATRGVTPEERWQDWKRINERIAVAAVDLPAEKFVAEVPEPTDAELRQLYNDHKDRVDGIPEPVMGVLLPSPNPGFKEPRRVKLQYLSANVSDWTQKLSDTVTDEEIADYYERNKRSQFVKIDSATSVDGLFDDEDDATEDDATEDEASEGDDEASEVESGEDVSEANSADAPADDESGNVLRKSPFRLAALQAEAEAPAGGAQADENEPSTSDSEEAAEGEATEDVPEGPAAPESPEEDEEEVDYVPLEDVSDQIRRTLARDKAVVELQKIVDRTYAVLQSAYNPYGADVVDARANEKETPAPPAKIADYKAIATETGLISEETVLLSRMELSETFVGKSFDAQSRSEFVVQGMFAEDQELFEPYRSMDLDGNTYIVCKVQDVPARVPDFEEVREAVLTAWKNHEAGKLALAKAEELAKQAQDDGKAVADVGNAAGYESLTTDMFSWLGFGTTPQEMQRGPRLGDAPPLEAIDDNNMVAMFDLEPEQAKAILNHDGSHAYVVQLDRRELTDDQMRQQFLNEANTWYGARVMTGTRQQGAYYKVVNELTRQAGLDLDQLQKFLSNDSE